MEQDTLILVDADSVYFRCCMVTQKEKDVRKYIKDSINDIKRKCITFSDGQVLIAVKGKDNFRYNVYDQYKGNRKRELEPEVKKCLTYGHHHLLEKYDAKQCDGMEADDMVAIWAWECILSETPYVVVHIDKDLDMIPGMHYNFIKEESYYVDFDTAHYNFMRQLLMGDTADNIPGVKGIGPKKAEKLLEGIPFEKRYQVVKNTWGGNVEAMNISARLLWMSTTFEEAEQHNIQITERMKAATLDEFWLGKQEELDEETNEEPLEDQTSECEQDVREEGEDDLQDTGVSSVSE